MDSESPLIQARKRKGKSQTDIASSFGVSQPTVSHWETGETVPHPSMWPEIAKEYGVSMTRIVEFFTREKAAS